jgi:hypothetical protein
MFYALSIFDVIIIASFTIEILVTFIARAHTFEAIALR